MKVRFLAVALISIAAGACSTLGPKANVSLIKSEIKKTSTVENIYVAKTTGLDNSGNLGKAVAGATLAAYGTRSRPSDAVEGIVGNIGAPEGVATILTVGYQASFAEYVKKYASKTKRPDKLTLPGAKKKIKVPKKVAGLKKFSARLKKKANVVQELAKVMSSGDSDALAKQMKKSKGIMPIIHTMNQFVFEQLDATYILLTHIEGNEASYKEGEKVKFAAALVNVKTGKLRYFAYSEGGKGTVPIPFVAWAPNTFNSMFNAVVEQDELPELEAEG